MSRLHAGAGRGAASAALVRKVINVGQPASLMLPKAVPIVIGWSTTSTDPLLDVDLFVQLLGP